MEKLSTYEWNEHSNSKISYYKISYKDNEEVDIYIPGEVDEFVNKLEETRKENKLK